MTEKELLKKIQTKLEQEGTKFAEYYGGTIIHSEGPMPKEFFKNVNEGNYSINILIIPTKFFIKTIDEQAVSNFLT